jgi:hypothetical protein
MENREESVDQFEFEGYKEEQVRSKSPRSGPANVLGSMIETMGMTLLGRHAVKKMAESQDYCRTRIIISIYNDKQVSRNHIEIHPC